MPDRNINSGVITIRLQNPELEAIDQICELSEFRSRNECVRYLLQPALESFVEAINTKSVWKASLKKISSEMDLNARLKLASKNANKNAQLELPELQVNVQPA